MGEGTCRSDCQSQWRRSSPVKTQSLLMKLFLVLDSAEKWTNRRLWFKLNISQTKELTESTERYVWWLMGWLVKTEFLSFLWISSLWNMLVELKKWTWICQVDNMMQPKSCFTVGTVFLGLQRFPPFSLNASIVLTTFCFISISSGRRTCLQKLSSLLPMGLFVN